MIATICLFGEGKRCSSRLVENVTRIHSESISRRAQSQILGSGNASRTVPVISTSRREGDGYHALRNVLLRAWYPSRWPLFLANHPHFCRHDIQLLTAAFGHDDVAADNHILP